MNLTFKNSVNNAKVSEEHKQKWIENGIKELERTGEAYYCVSSGDSMLLIWRLHEEDGGGYEINITSNYKQAHYKNNILK